MPPVVTYALIANAQSFANARNCGRIVTRQASPRTTSNIARTDFVREVHAAFDMYGSAPPR